MDYFLQSLTKSDTTLKILYRQYLKSKENNLFGDFAPYRHKYKGNNINFLFS